MHYVLTTLFFAKLTLLPFDLPPPSVTARTRNKPLVCMTVGEGWRRKLGGRVTAIGARFEAGKARRRHDQGRCITHFLYAVCTSTVSFVAHLRAYQTLRRGRRVMRLVISPSRSTPPWRLRSSVVQQNLECWRVGAKVGRPQEGREGARRRIKWRG